MRQDQPTSRLIPSKGAAIALWTLDALLCAGWALFSRQGSWFLVVYLPLLGTLALGVMMSGYGLLVGKFVGAAVLLLNIVLFSAFAFQLVHFDQVGTLLAVLGSVLGVIASVPLGFAVAGWFRFFAGRPAAA